MNCLAGLDLGSVQVKLVVLEPDNQRRPLFTIARPSQGKAFQVAMEMLAEATSALGPEVRVHPGVTGASAPLFTGGENDGAWCETNQLTAAVSAVAATHGEVRTIIDLGGQFSKWILVGSGTDAKAKGIEDFALNGQCAAGSGLFLDQQAARLGLSVAELGRLAESAGRGATIAGRCSVFAKSDMIHLHQKGTPLNEIAYGLCLALVRTFVGTVLENRRIQAPLAFIGGGAANSGLIRAFLSVLGLGRDEIIIPADALFSSAIGAAHAAKDFPPVVLAEWLTRQHAKRSAVISVNNTLDDACAGLSRPVGGSERHIQPENPNGGLPQSAEEIPVHLGIDVGSVSTNMVLLSPELAYLDGVYIATAGRPLTALDLAFRELKKRHGDKLKILSVGATGSGRYLAGQLVGADLVKNEITAQLVSAAHFFPDVETVFEIGGQDAKFINVRDGVLQDFEMNKICSAGTGSFLEEQANRMGVAIVGEFSELAFKSRKPVVLASRCTVFMDTEICRAMAANHPLADLCAGLAYAVARNYIEKVAAGRKIGSAVVFQGGTSSNSAVVSAFSGLLGRPIRVHPYGRVSGAIGAALLAARNWTAKMSPKSRFRGFDSCRDYSLTGFECGKCANRCRVNRIEVGGQRVHFGDICERFSSRDTGEIQPIAKGKKLPFKELFATREAHLVSALPEKTAASGRARVGLIRTSLMLEYLPFWTHLLNELNFEPVVTAGMIGDGENHGISTAICLPQKLAAAEIHHLFREQRVERVLMPSILELDPCQARDRAHTCLYSQQLPDMLRPIHGERLLMPQLGLSRSRDLRREGSQALSEALGMSKRKIEQAWKIALQHQAAFGEARRELGREALAGLTGKGVVIIGKPYNLHDPRTNLGLAGQLARIGLPAIPMDLLPLDGEHLDDAWYMLPWLLNRYQLRALQLLQAHPHLYPIHVSNYGCGPDAFTIKHLQRYWGNRPRLFLEFDGHRGEAGLVTRLEAFADEIENDAGKEKGRRTRRAPWKRDNNAIAQGTRCLLPYTSEHVHVYAGMLRRAGFLTKILPPPDEASARLGETFSSGRECHPFTLIAGDLVKCVKRGYIASGDRFFIPGTRLPCLLSQYGDGFRHVLEDLGEERLRIFDPHPGETARMFGTSGMIDLYEGLTLIDYLIIAACHLRPYERESGTVNRWLADSCRKVEESLAEKSDKRICMAPCIESLDRIAVDKNKQRPVIGVTGDLYTRINAAGNSGLFTRIEEMGCEVWPSPFFAASTDFELPQESHRWRRRGNYTRAFSTAVTAALLRTRAKRLAAHLSPELRVRCVEPPQAVLQPYALPYISANSNHLIRTMIAKMVDFARRGADGVISAIGLNCMAGTAAAAAISQIRKDQGGLPLICLSYGGTEGLSQKILLDTFVLQVHARYRQRMPE
ncbi:MAG: acyl-CoA dehydratase activase [Pseudomonadota bacterium]